MLGSCSLVSRRFHALVLLVDSVFVRVDCVIPTTRRPPPPPLYLVLLDVCFFNSARTRASDRWNLLALVQRFYKLTSWHVLL